MIDESIKQQLKEACFNVVNESPELAQFDVKQRELYANGLNEMMLARFKAYEEQRISFDMVEVFNDSIAEFFPVRSWIYDRLEKVSPNMNGEVRAEMYQDYMTAFQAFRVRHKTVEDAALEFSLKRWGKQLRLGEV